MHIGTDVDSGLIRKAVLTTAKIHDSQMIKYLVCGDEDAIMRIRLTSVQSGRNR